tara:strand:+ start:5473 stop:6201 length:729 start_codon:yes stop_codon:yes gene_type:complete
MCLHAVAGVDCTLQRPHHRNGRHDLVLLLVPQHLEHADVVDLALGLLEYAAIVADDDCVCCDDDGWLAALRVVDLAAVHILRLRRGGLEDVVEGAQFVGQIFGKLGGADVDVGQAKLCAVSDQSGAKSPRGSRLTWARSCRRRGEADASTTRCRLSVFNDSKFNGGGGPGGGRRAPGVPEALRLCAAAAVGVSSYGGGGSEGRRLALDMAALCREWKHGNGKNDTTTQQDAQLERRKCQWHS